MKIFRGCMKDGLERKKNIIFIIAIAFCIIFSRDICSSIKSYKYRRLCNQYREQLITAEEANRELTETIGDCQRITESIGELCNGNINSSRGIIEFIEQIRTQVYELENCLGCFSQLEYYQYWDSFYRDEGLME